MATWIEKIKQAHLAVTDAVCHQASMKSDRYFVWQEDGVDDLILNDRHAERRVTGTTDLYTKMEFDPWAEEIEKSFDTAGIVWKRNSIQYEEETGFTHLEWRWRV